MTEHRKEIELPAGGRAFKRKTLIDYFVIELPGTGSGEEASKYRYDVEKYGPYRIYLNRPGRLNKGIDFQVNIEGVFFKSRSRIISSPRHADVIEALEYCKLTQPIEYPKVADAVNGVFNCEEPDMSDLGAYFLDYEGNRHPIQVIVLALKWLFMEQDCTYWNYSGRGKLYAALRELDLV